MAVNNPTPEQIEALRKFAKRHGPAWRTVLLHAWASGEDTRCEDGHLLRQLRNQVGPQGLKKLNLEF